MIRINSDNPCDLVTWAASADGSFTIKSAIQTLHDNQINPHNSVFNEIWSWIGPQRIKAFLWFLASDALLTNSSRVKRRLTNQDTCSICNHNSESTLHAIRDCSWAKQAWMHFVPYRQQREFFNLNLHDWISFNLSALHGTYSRKRWSLIFGFTAAGVWAGRNAHIFYGLVLNIQSTCSSIRRSLAEAFQIFVLPQQQHMLLGNSHINWVHWERPEFGWIKLNSDGSSVVSTYQGACGGIFRNHHGNFILAYATHLQNVSPLEAELIGILKGLQFAWRNKYNNLIVEVDSAHVIRLLNAGCPESHPLHSLLFDIQTLVQRAWLVHFQHTMRETNQVANNLAAYGLQLASNDSDCIFHDIPAFISLCLAADYRGTWFPRSL
ncbi:Ribonuclease H domain [Sesbania bispinosa]|nr:Ribonuclease H domain [Sesbania bispinosa]